MIADILFWVVFALFIYVLCSILGGCAAALVKIILQLGVVIAGIVLIIVGYLALLKIFIGVLV